MTNDSEPAANQPPWPGVRDDQVEEWEPIAREHWQAGLAGIPAAVAEAGRQARNHEDRLAALLRDELGAHPEHLTGPGTDPDGVEPA